MVYGHQFTLGYVEEFGFGQGMDSGKAAIEVVGLFEGKDVVWDEELLHHFQSLSRGLGFLETLILGFQFGEVFVQLDFFLQSNV